MKCASPRLPRVLEPIQPSQVQSDETLEAVVLINADFSGQSLNRMAVESSRFGKTLFIGTQLEKLGLMDVELKAPDLSGAHCGEASLLRVYVAGGRLSGTDFSRSTLQDVTFTNCKLNMTNFRAAKLVRVQFIDCILQEADFQMAQLTDVTFQACQLEKTEFAQSISKNVDLRTSELIDLRSVASLKGMIIDTVQLTSLAPLLAHELGITVDD